MVNMNHKKIQTTVDKLAELCTVSNEVISDFVYISTDYKKDARPPEVDSSWLALNAYDSLEGVDKHFWIFKKIITPQKESDATSVFFNLCTGRENGWDATNPQCLVFINGHAVQGLDINHRDIALEFGKEYEVYLYLYTGMEEGKFDFIPSLKIVDNKVENLYYDMCVPFESLSCLDENDDNAVTITKYLIQTCNLIDFRVPYSDEFYKSINTAQQFITEEFYHGVCGNADSTVSCIGHTHIDIAWKWTLAQTEEKAQRSFATALSLMNEYNDFIFMSSQPQLYQYVKDNDSELYQKIKQRIKDGHWEAEGAMWLEADCNLSSGESLVRQIIKGKQFFMDEFGIDSKILWLPDVFGYSSALPQILKKSGIDKFVTSKISWNETNKLPYDVFMWEGLDGTEIFTSFITAQDYVPGEAPTGTTYVGFITPKMVMGTRKRFQQKDYSKRGLITFGYGDGGGGATRQMIEYHRRLSYGIPGFPKTVIEPVGNYLNKLESDFIENSRALKKTPKWVGELYLEFHRGTYTSIAKNKKNNRNCEFSLQGAEQLSIAAELFVSVPYPKEKINECWGIVLLNQFHDIIPGSSIEEVYQESDKQYAYVKAEKDKIISNALRALSNKIDSNGKTVIYNPNSFMTSGPVRINGEMAYVHDIPPMGWLAVDKIDFTNTIKVSKDKIESSIYTILFDENLNITSIFDKEYNREVIAPGACANEIEAFEDMPYQFDNWELSSYYTQKKWCLGKPESVDAISDGIRAGLKITRRFLNSKIEQKIFVYENLRRIDFENDIDWKESHIVLKAAFPLNVHSNVANYETQFGYIARPTHQNTPYDAAKFEVCAHKYGDISEDNYGVALMNDCKYGYSAEGNILKLTLLKCGTEPNKNADKERHSFTYSLLPHYGNHCFGGVVQQAYLLNRPLIVLPECNGKGLPAKYSLVSCDCENIICETLKKAEKSDAIIVRAYDAYNRKCNAEFTFGFNVRAAYLCDLLENKIEKLNVKEGNKLNLMITNFEIVTIMIES